MNNRISIHKSNILNFSAQKKGRGKSFRVEINESSSIRLSKIDKMRFLLKLEHDVQIYGGDQKGEGEDILLAQVNLAVEHYCSGLEIKNSDKNSKNEMATLKDNLVPYSISKVNSMLSDIGMPQIPIDAFYKSDKNPE